MSTNTSGHVDRTPGCGAAGTVRRGAPISTLPRPFGIRRGSGSALTTQIDDLDRHRLLDVIEGRSADVLGSWLAERGVDWCAGITLATLDPAAGYRKALDTHLPNTVRAVDHIQRLRENYTSRRSSLLQNVRPGP